MKRKFEINKTIRFRRSSLPQLGLPITTADSAQMKIDEQIKRINEKLQLMLNQFLIVKKENEKLRQELKQLKLKDIEQHTQIETLLQRVEILKASKAQMSEDEKRAFEKRINQYLKEIEKCITLIQQ